MTPTDDCDGWVDDPPTSQTGDVGGVNFNSPPPPPPVPQRTMPVITRCNRRGCICRGWLSPPQRGVDGSAGSPLPRSSLRVIYLKRRAHGDMEMLAFFYNA